MMSPRPGLIPATAPRSSAGSAASSVDQLAQRLGRDHEALDAEVEAAATAR